MGVITYHGCGHAWMRTVIYWDTSYYDVVEGWYYAGTVEWAQKELSK